MTKQISFEAFLEELSLKTSLSQEALKPLVFELFVHVRTNTECGLWVEVENFGSFHPLWYEIKKHKENKEDMRIRKEIEEEKKREAERLRQEAKEAEWQRVQKEKKVAEADKIRKEKFEAEQKREKERLEQEVEEMGALRLKQEQDEIERLEAKKVQEALEVKQQRAKEEAERLKRQSIQKEEEEKERIRQAELEAEENRKKQCLKQEAEALRLKQEQVEVERLQKLRYEKEAAEAARINNEKLLKQAELEEAKRREEAFAQGSHNLLRIKQKALKKRDKKALRHFLVLTAFIILTFWMMKDDAAITSHTDKKHSEQEAEKVVYTSFSALEKTEKTTSEKFYNYTLELGDSLYSISKRIYGDSKFWPLIYVYNKDQIKDVDKICLGDILKLSHIPQGSSAQEVLSEVYIQAYKAYKQVGKDNKAHWLLYWGSRHIDRDLLKKFSSDIKAEDRVKVKSYLKRFDAL